MRKFAIIFLLFCLCSASRAQILFSDSLRISLLTIDPGPEVYECFGHTGIRINDLKKGQDIVFHYGVYNYNEPNFLWHFVLGQCNYMMGASYTNRFFEEYKYRRLSITEQTLNLDSIQSKSLVQALSDNYLPRNRNYRYNYFFDNCATRPFQILNRNTPIQYDTAWIQPISLRDMVQEMTGRGNWLDFGISLVVAGRADQRASFSEQMFLPQYLCQALDNAFVAEQKFVSEKTIHRFGTISSNQKGGSYSSSLFNPMSINILILILAILLTLIAKVWQAQKRAFQISLQIFDSIWLLGTGTAGIIVWFLNFFSEHPAVDHNLNCWWLLPTNLLFIILIWIKKAEKVRLIYFFIIFAAEIIYIILICCSNQYCHPAFIPLLAVMVIRSIDRICSNTNNKSNSEGQE